MNWPFSGNAVFLGLSEAAQSPIGQPLGYRTSSTLNSATCVSRYCENASNAFPRSCLEMAQSRCERLCHLPIDFSRQQQSRRGCVGHWNCSDLGRTGGEEDLRIQYVLLLGRFSFGLKPSRNFVRCGLLGWGETRRRRMLRRPIIENALASYRYQAHAASPLRRRREEYLLWHGSGVRIADQRYRR
jgi:hypothetical protein